MQTANIDNSIRIYIPRWSPRYGMQLLFRLPKQPLHVGIPVASPSSDEETGVPREASIENPEGSIPSSATLAQIVSSILSLL
jgi:hypothetical protein